MLPEDPWIWRSSSLQVERLGQALWLESEGDGLLIGAPAGVTAALGDRRPRLRSVLLSSGRLERVCGLVELLSVLDRGSNPLVIRFPMTDERAALLVEAWQRGWARYPVTLDALGPGGEVDVGAAVLRAEALSDGEGPPPLGLRLSWSGVTVAMLPRCRFNGAASRVASGCDLLVVEDAGGLSAGEAARLAGDADLWFIREGGLRPS